MIGSLWGIGRAFEFFFLTLQKIQHFELCVPWSCVWSVLYRSCVRYLRMYVAPQIQIKPGFCCCLKGYQSRSRSQCHYSGKVLKSPFFLYPKNTGMWVFPKIMVPQNGWFILENPIKMDDLGIPPFLETPMS